MNRVGCWALVGVLLWAVPVVSLAALKSDDVPSDDVPIEIQVEVTEVDHIKASNLGVEWLDRVGFSETSPPGLVAVGPVERLTSLHADLHFLVEEGAAELLANPNLITNSGTMATFHAGGQIPYITSSTLGTTHVEFKPYGVALNVRPDLTEDGQIHLSLRASVSAPDRSNGVTLSGNTVPALLEREVTSNVSVAPGTTMTLAGLVQTQKEETVRGVPFFRNIPLVGFLFRWRRTNFRRTTVVMFVTPRLVEF